ncbi:MAG: Wadjet anti-phage system protein JetD domain-containing protein [Treponema sp.]
MQLFYPYKIQNELLSSVYNINYQIFLRISLILYSIKRTDYSAGTFYIFLSGYHNSAKQNFIKKIHRQNPEKEYLHFGDIDPDGFYILQNLRTKTKINFKPHKMGIAQLEKYSSFTKNQNRKSSAGKRCKMGQTSIFFIMEFTSIPSLTLQSAHHSS